MNGPAGTPVSRITASGVNRLVNRAQSPDLTASLNAVTCSATRSRAALAAPLIMVPVSGWLVSPMARPSRPRLLAGPVG